MYVASMPTFSKTIIVNCKVVVGHAVPLAKYPSTEKKLGLSFNNTIFSLIVDLPDKDMVTMDKNFDTYDYASYFHRTFDGTSWKN